MNPLSSVRANFTSGTCTRCRNGSRILSSSSFATLRRPSAMVNFSYVGPRRNVRSHMVN